VPHPHDLNGLVFDPVDNHIGPDGRNLPSAGDQARSPAFGEVFESVACRHELDSDPGRRGRTLISDMGPYRREVREGFRRLRAYRRGQLVVCAPRQQPAPHVLMGNAPAGVEGSPASFDGRQECGVVIGLRRQGGHRLDHEA